MQIPPDPEYINLFISNALAEDVGPGDHTTLATVPAGARGRAVCRIKEPGILAGTAVAEKVFRFLDSSVTFSGHFADGQPVQVGDIAFEVEGTLRALLSGERLALNIMQRMSGIATFTRQVVGQLEGTSCRLLDTRKTTPLFRAFEKWAVRIGGGYNHRFGLYDMLLIKDNHIDFAGGVAPAIARTKEYLQANDLPLKIEVEARTLAEVEQILAAGGIDRILLDNMSLADMAEAVRRIGGQAETEASGNMTLERVRPVAETGVDFISMGALTHTVHSLDISVKAKPLN